MFFRPLFGRKNQSEPLAPISHFYQLKHTGGQYAEMDLADFWRLSRQHLLPDLTGVG
jgi:hypothetical protein